MVKIFPTTTWKSLLLKAGESDLFTVDGIEKMYYVKVVEGK